MAHLDGPAIFVELYYDEEWAFRVARLVKIHLQWRPDFDPWVGKIPWRRAWQPTPVFLPGESHGLRSLAGGLQFMGPQRVRHD